MGVANALSIAVRASMTMSQVLHAWRASSASPPIPPSRTTMTRVVTTFQDAAWEGFSAFPTFPTLTNRCMFPMSQRAASITTAAQEGGNETSPTLDMRGAPGKTHLPSIAWVLRFWQGWTSPSPKPPPFPLPSQSLSGA